MTTLPARQFTLATRPELLTRALAMIDQVEELIDQIERAGEVLGDATVEVLVELGNFNNRLAMLCLYLLGGVQASGDSISFDDEQTYLQAAGTFIAAIDHQLGSAPCQ